jgi:hypothetical protein
LCRCRRRIVELARVLDLLDDAADLVVGRLDLDASSSPVMSALFNGLEGSRPPTISDADADPSLVEASVDAVARAALRPAPTAGVPSGRRPSGRLQRTSGKTQKMPMWR